MVTGILRSFGGMRVERGRCVRCLTIGSVLAAVGLTSSAYADRVSLITGDVLIGEVTSQTADEVIVMHDVLGQLVIPRSQVGLVEVDGADDTTTAPLATPEEAIVEVQPADPIEPADEVSEWKSHLSLSTASSFGNTDTQVFQVGVTSLRERPADRTKLDALYYYGATSGDRSDNRFSAGFLHDWLMPDSPWLWFADGRYDYDEFQSWEHRINAHLGAGYQLVDEEDLQVTVRGGLGFVREFKSANQDWRPEALFGGDFTWQISEKQKLTGGTTIYPDLDDMGEYRVVSGLDWSMLLDEERAMSLKAGLAHEYQSTVAAGIDEHDLRLYAGLQFDF